MKKNPLKNEVEFSNNGIIDSLTGSPAPKLFLDNLAREIAKSKRKFQAISIVTVKVILETNYSQASSKVLTRNPLQVYERALGVETRNREATRNREKATTREFEKELITVGLNLKSKIRRGDFYSRFAENGFWICIQGDISDAEKTSERISSNMSISKKVGKTGVSFNFTENEWDSNMDQAELIRSIDMSYFGS